MPTGIAAQSNSVVDGKIYVIAGVNQQTVVRTTYEYDPEANKVTRKADAEIARVMHARRMPGG